MCKILNNYQQKSGVVRYSGGKIVQSFRGVLADMSLHDVSLTESTSEEHIESRSAVTIRYLWV